MAEKIKHFRELNVYRIAKSTAMEIFEVSKYFPQEEKSGLTGHIRKSSRSVCANLAEAWRRRRYRAAFICKLNECEAECSEVQVWLEFAKECKYISDEIFKRIDEQCESILSMLVNMINSADKWTLCVAEDPTAYLINEL